MLVTVIEVVSYRYSSQVAVAVTDIRCSLPLQVSGVSYRRMHQVLVTVTGMRS